ncbi:hypothetical protein BdWA1_000131 [Babesia duncani]|uniref:Uncharacterized protein n=1 Tax=Babesia duncani TaxID=323732 RepID=A0AAD9PMH9_9APIC|nr:hypothetical protein BdWA1_000131 [Babesia duncani]
MNSSILIVLLFLFFGVGVHSQPETQLSDARKEEIDIEITHSFLCWLAQSIDKYTIRNPDIDRYNILEGEGCSNFELAGSRTTAVFVFFDERLNALKEKWMHSFLEMEKLVKSDELKPILKNDGYCGDTVVIHRNNVLSLEQWQHIKYIIHSGLQAITLLSKIAHFVNEYPVLKPIFLLDETWKYMYNIVSEDDDS